MNGIYAIYKGKEYKANRRGNKIVLFSKETEDIRKGFNLNLLTNTYELLVDRIEVEKYYTKTLYCKYRNDSFMIADETDTSVLLISGPRSYLLDELGFEQIDRGEFKKWVLKEDITDREERIKERTWERRNENI